MKYRQNEDPLKFVFTFKQFFCIHLFLYVFAIFVGLGDFGGANRNAFVANLRRLGWSDENEELLFDALNLQDKQELRTRDLTFFAVDKRKFTKARKVLWLKHICSIQMYL